MKLIVVIHCNGVEVLNMVLSDNVCTVCPVPVEVQRIWTITYNCVKLIVVIHCNGVEVLNMVLSDSVCTKHSWTTYWEQSNGYVYFYNQDGNYTESVYIYTQIQFGILFPWNPDTQNISVSTDSTAGSGVCVLL